MKKTPGGGGGSRSRMFGPSITCNLITHTLTMYHVNLTLSTALGQKRFDLQSLSPTLYDLLVISLIAVGF